MVLVTGAAGRIGTGVLRELRGRGVRTRALVHRRPVPDADEQSPGALHDEDSLLEAARGVDVVVHLAACTHARSGRAYQRANAEGTSRVLHASEVAEVSRFVHVSTRAISGDGGGYSRSKAAAERRVRASPLEHVIVRLPEVYGAGGKEGIDDMIERARRGALIPVVGPGEEELCPVHLDEAVGAVVAAVDADAAAGRTYTLGGQCRPMREVAEICSRAFGGRSRVVSLPVATVAAASAAARILPLPLYPDQLARLRAEKPPPSPEAQSDLGFVPRPLEQRLAEIAGQ